MSSVVSSAVALFYIVPGSSSRKKVRVRVSNMLSKVPLRSNRSGAFFRTRCDRSRCLRLCPNNPGTMLSKVLLRSNHSRAFFRTRSGSSRCLGQCPNNPGTMLSKVLLRSNHSRAFFPNSIWPLSMPGTISEQHWDFVLDGSSSLESLPSFFSELDLAALDAWNYIRTTLGLCSRW